MANIKKGDLVKIEFTARTAIDGTVIETTDEEIAKKNNIWSKDNKYGPKLIIAQSGFMLIGLEEALAELEVGQEKEFKINYEKAFGPRKKELVRVMSLKDFEKQKIKPTKGMLLNIENAFATVKSVNSGRVVVDFNHPLAGQDLIYKLKLVELITEPKEKCYALAKEFDAKIFTTSENGKIIVNVESIDKNKKNSFELALKISLQDLVEVKYK
jgi:FKBP-type peptidyl-prolyl cis-trans isomerase 2